MEAKNNLVVVDRNDIELIASIECYGTWEFERVVFSLGESFDIWSWNGKLYKIYKDSNRLSYEPEII